MVVWVPVVSPLKACYYRVLTLTVAVFTYSCFTPTVQHFPGGLDAIDSGLVLFFGRSLSKQMLEDKLKLFKIFVIRLNLTYIWVLIEGAIAHYS